MTKVPSQVQSLPKAVSYRLRPLVEVAQDLLKEKVYLEPHPTSPLQLLKARRALFQRAQCQVLAVEGKVRLATKPSRPLNKTALEVGKSNCPLSIIPHLK